MWNSWHPEGAQKCLLLVCQTEARATPSCSLGDRQSGSRVRLWSHPSLAWWPWVGCGGSGELSERTSTAAPGSGSVGGITPSLPPMPIKAPHRLSGTLPREKGLGTLGFLGLGSWGTDQAPRGAAVSQATFRGCPGEAQGRGGQCPDLSTNRAGSWLWSTFLSAQPSMGGWWGPAGPAGAERCLGTGHGAGPAAPSPTRWVTATDGSERPCRLVAGCPPISCTMSDGEGPSAGEWQCYIYPPRLRLQSQGCWSLRALGAPTPGCRQLWGWTPFLLA